MNRNTFADMRLLLARSSTSFGLDPEHENIGDAPHPIGHSGRHRPSTGGSNMPGGTQFIMDHTKVVDTADQIRVRLKRLQPMSGIPTAAGRSLLQNLTVLVGTPSPTRH